MLDQLVQAPCDIQYHLTGGQEHFDRVAGVFSEAGWSINESLGAVGASESRTLFWSATDSARLRGSVKAGQPSTTSGRLAGEALRSACAYAKEFGCAGIFTAPLSKEWVVAGGIEGFSGHTGFLEEALGGKAVMLMHGAELSVIPLTIHVPLRHVADELKKELLNPTLIQTLRQLLELPALRHGPWAVLGLNPHAGEGGHLGTEERDWLSAVIQAWKTAGLPVEGPLPADAAFLPEVRVRYRLILGCYHDQVLTPFKALEGRRGINCTLGLPYLRTSPDHGTAFELAAAGKGDDTSMRAAWKFLVDRYAAETP